MRIFFNGSEVSSCYETAGGLTVEVSGQTLPIFDASFNRVDWFDLPDQQDNLQSDLADTYSSSRLKMLVFWLGLEREVQAYMGSPYAAPTQSTESLFAEIADAAAKACLGLSNAAQKIRNASQVFAPRVIRFLCHAVTLNGKPCLLPTYARKTAEATAKENAVHFEMVVLSKQHSDLDGSRSIRMKIVRSAAQWISSLTDLSNLLGRWPRQSRSRPLGVGTPIVNHPFSLC